MLRSPAEVQEAKELSGPVVPHTDEVLTRRPKEYARFIMDLAERNLVSLQPAAKATVGVFFVPKKRAGELRMILDTRAANLHF